MKNGESRIDKRSVIIVLLILTTAGMAFAAQDQQIQQKLAALEKIPDKFTFAVLGDSRSGHEIYQRIVSLAMERKPDFIVNTGDMIATPGDLKEWALFWKMSGPVTVPYFLTVGNHDAHPMSPLSEKMYKEQVDLPGNELYYSFTAGKVLFIVLDSCLDGQEKRITGEQLSWLQGVLENSSHEHKLVFLHHPLYPDGKKGRHHGNSLDRYPSGRDRLQALFVKFNVAAVFAGHEHYYHRTSVDGITHVITGGGGAPLYGDEKDGGFHHFVRVTVDGGKVSAEAVDIRGNVRDRF